METPQKITKKKKMQNKKICLIGYGYWGKILEKNLIEIGFTDISLIDIRLNNLDHIHEEYDLYFISTPFFTHFDILSKVCSYRNKIIWCEKPLVHKKEDLEYIYILANNSNSSLFVDWVYAYNEGINYVKSFLVDKEIFQVILNRTNDGPARTDSDSRWDLSSHDLSILFHVFGEIEIKKFWNEFSMRESEEFGSNLSTLITTRGQVIINSSWQHGSKNRSSIFIMNDMSTLIINDLSKKIFFNGSEILDFSDSSPLKNSIYTFLRNDPSEFDYNKELTMKITNALQ